MNTLLIDSPVDGAANVLRTAVSIGEDQPAAEALGQAGHTRRQEAPGTGHGSLPPWLWTEGTPPKPGSVWTGHGLSA